MPIDEGQFESLLDQIRELHRRTDEITRERVRFDAHVRARLNWDERNAPPLPREQRDIADEVVDVLSKPRLSTPQVRRLYRAFFGR